MENKNLKNLLKEIDKDSSELQKIDLSEKISNRIAEAGLAEAGKIPGFVKAGSGLKLIILPAIVALILGGTHFYRSDKTSPPVATTPTAQTSTSESTAHSTSSTATTTPSQTTPAQVVETELTALSKRTPGSVQSARKLQETTAPTIRLSFRNSDQASARFTYKISGDREELKDLQMVVQRKSQLTKNFIDPMGSEYSLFFSKNTELGTSYRVHVIGNWRDQKVKSNVIDVSEPHEDANSDEKAATKKKTSSPPTDVTAEWAEHSSAAGIAKAMIQWQTTSNENYVISAKFGDQDVKTVAVVPAFQKSYLYSFEHKDLETAERFTFLVQGIESNELTKRDFDNASEVSENQNERVMCAGSANLHRLQYLGVKFGAPKSPVLCQLFLSSQVRIDGKAWICGPTAYGTVAYHASNVAQNALTGSQLKTTAGPHHPGEYAQAVAECQSYFANVKMKETGPVGCLKSTYDRFIRFNYRTMQALPEYYSSLQECLSGL